MLSTQTVRLFSGNDHATGYDRSRGLDVLVAQVLLPGDEKAEIGVHLEACSWQIFGMPIAFTATGQFLQTRGGELLAVAVEFTERQAVVTIGPSPIRFAVILNSDFWWIRQRCLETPDFPTVPADVLIPGPERTLIASYAVVELMQRNGDQWYDLPSEQRRRLIQDCLDRVQQVSGEYDAARTESIFESLAAFVAQP